MVNLQEIRTFIEEQKLKNGIYSVWNERKPEKVEFLKVGKRVWDGVMLKEDVGFELGSPDFPMVKTFLTQTESSSIHNMRITLIGQDIPDILETNPEFGILFLISSSSLSPSDYRKLERTTILSNSIEGVFEKQVGRKSWYQISTELLKRKLSFYHIGSALIQLIKQEFHEKIDAIEEIIVVNNNLLLDYFREIHKVSRIESIKRFQEKIKTIQKLRPDCDFENECNVCDNREICDQIRDVIAKRNEMRRMKK